ncbi:two-component sensor histidine kinase [Marivirga lumbricoides]|uniref:histidine kinase n=1 Tax=Marivirga lumbricoides TaxID=1046115 RepID=A0ABQ1MYA1_9BACT|nr:two-component sensor histidine kinase [Marivirga lumbricoides]
MLPFFLVAQNTPEKELNELLSLYAINVSSNPALAKNYAEKLKSLSTTYNLPAFTAKAHYALGNIAFKAGKFDSSIYEIRKAINFLDSLNIEKGRAACYNLIAVCYKNNGDLTSSMQNFEESLFWANKLGDSKNEANAYQNISLIYFQQKNYIDAAKNLDRALVLYTDLNDYDGVISTRFNFANILKEQGKFEEARKFYNEVMDYYQQQGDKIMEAYVGINLGQILMEEERFKEALPRLIDTKNKLESLNLRADMGMILNDLGFCNQNLGFNEDAIKYFTKALAFTDENPDLYYVGEIYQNLSILYAENGQYKKALEFYKKQVAQKEKQNSLEKEKHLATLQEKYETRLKEAQITLLEQEKSLKDAELQQAATNLKKQQLIRNISLAGFLILLIVLIVIRYFYKQKISFQKQLADQQEEIAQQKTNELIKDFRLSAIERYQQGQQQERARIAREIHDGIGSDLAGLKIAFEQYLGNAAPSKESSRILLGIRNACQDLRSISHKLHPPAFSQVGFCDFIRDFAEQTTKGAELEIHTIFFPKDKIDALPEDLLADVYRISQELISNIIKHALASTVELQLTLHETYLNIVVSDNGIGITDKNTNKGIGLRNIRERLISRNGTMEIDSSEKGTVVNIDMGINKITSTNEIEI